MAPSSNNNNRRRAPEGPARGRGTRAPRRETPVEEALREEKDREMKVEIGTIVFVALMLLLFLCNFHIIGAFGEAVSGFMFGVCGLLAYIFPVFATLFMFFFRANRGNGKAMKKLFASTLLYVLVGIICDMASKTAVSMESYSFTGLFTLGKEGRCGGGLLSGTIAYFIKSWLGQVGLVLLVILGIIISLVLLTEKSFINMIKNKTLDVKDRGMEYLEERRERQRIEQEERAQLSEERRSRLEDKSNTPQAENAQQDHALNVRDKLRQGDVEAPVIDNGTVVPMPPEAPPVNDINSYKPNLRDSLKEKFEAQKEKYRIDKELRREAKENDAILQVAQNNEYYGGNTGYGSTQDMHEITYDDGTGSAYPRQNSGYDQNYRDGQYYDQYYEEYNDQSYPQGAGQNDSQAQNYTGQNAPYDEEGEILKYKINNGETLVDMYGRPVFNFEKEPVRSEHSVVVKDEFDAMSGVQDEESTETYNNDEDILSSGDEDIMATYEKVTREQELKRASEESPDVRKVITPVERKKPVAVPVSEEKEDLWASDSVNSEPEKVHYENEKPVNRSESSEKRADAGTEFKNRPYKFPPTTLLKSGKGASKGDREELENTKYNLQETLRNFGVNVEITEAVQGPTVTRYEMTLEPGTKVSKILGLSDDIKLSLASADIRIEAPIPGKSAVGIEVPNKETSMVALRDLLESKEFKEAKSNLSFAVGKNIGGDVIVTDIGKMPHVLIAGSTGSGKSVCINTLIMSLIYKSTPEDVQMIMVDPKVVELSVYNGIPHLMLPVVTDPKKAAAALAWGVKEMESRYKKFADLSVRDLAGYNEKIKQLTPAELADSEAKGLSHYKLPKIVIIIDELADLMMVCGKEVEEAICRLAQLARACGIHLVVATQRPSVDVITGLIKANMPSRMAFAVSSGTDSRTILDSVGAEKLLGKGDMLFYPQGKPKPERLQGAFVSDEEVSAVVDFLKAQKLHNVFAEQAGINSDTLEAVSDSKDGKSSAASSGEDGDGRDELFAEAGRCIINSGKCSIGYLQRMLKIGFNRAARIMDSLSEEGVVGPESGTKAREILMTIEEFEQYLDS